MLSLWYDDCTDYISENPDGKLQDVKFSYCFWRWYIYIMKLYVGGDVTKFKNKFGYLQ